MSIESPAGCPERARASTRAAPTAAPPATPPTRVTATLVEALERGACSDAPFLVLHGHGPEQPLDARAALRLARCWAATLSAVGVRRGEPVALLLPTSADFVGALLGTMLLGGLPLPLPAPLTFGSLDKHLDNLGRIVRHAEARVLVTTARVRDALRTSTLAGALHVLLPGDRSGGETGTKSVSLDASGAALLQYTSGTSGNPKGVVVAHRALMANTEAIAARLSIKSNDVGVSWLPMYHDMGLVGVLLTAIAHPYTVHVMPPEAFIMKPRRWLELISRYRGTISSAPNFAYDYVARRPSSTAELDLSSWRVALDGAEPVHVSTLERFTRQFADQGLSPQCPCPAYGLAEATLAVCLHAPGNPLDVEMVDRRRLEVGGEVHPCAGGRAIVGCGPPVADTRVEIRGDGDVALPDGVVGEICVAGPGLMDGYYHSEAATATALAGGWLRTGDLGFLRAGRLFVSGRARELIIQGGRNIHPEDVERVALDADSRLSAAAAFATTNEDAGTEDVVLVLESSGLPEHGREAVAAKVRGEILAAIGVRTATVVFWPLGSIPRTSSGKVRRKQCSDRLRAVEEM